MKGIFLFSWSDPTPGKGTSEFRGVSLLHQRDFFIFVGLLHVKELMSFKEYTQLCQVFGGCGCNFIWLLLNLGYFAGRRLKFAHQRFAISAYKETCVA